MKAQLAEEEEVNGRVGLVVKRVSLQGSFILCRVLFHPTSPPPTHTPTPTRLQDFTLGLVWVQGGGVEHSLWDLPH